MLADDNIAIGWVGLQAFVDLGTKGAFLEEVYFLLPLVAARHVLPALKGLGVPLLMQAIEDGHSVLPGHRDGMLHMLDGIVVSQAILETCCDLSVGM